MSSLPPGCNAITDAKMFEGAAYVSGEIMSNPDYQGARSRIDVTYQSHKPVNDGYQPGVGTLWLKCDGANANATIAVHHVHALHAAEMFEKMAQLLREEVARDEAAAQAHATPVIEVQIGVSASVETCA